MGDGKPPLVYKIISSRSADVYVILMLFVIFVLLPANVFWTNSAMVGIFSTACLCLFLVPEENSFYNNKS